MLDRWTQLVIRRRVSILVSWMVLAIAGCLSVPHLHDHLTTSLAVPSSESDKADSILSAHFHENSEGAFTVLYKFQNASKKEIEGFEAQISVAASKIPNVEVTQQKALGGILFANISTPYDLATAASYVERFRDALVQAGLNEALVTGPPAIYHDITPILKKDLWRGQLFAIFFALLFLVIVLGASWAVLVPYIFSLATISGSLGLIFLLSQRILMVLYIPNIVELIGLGLAIDYSLLIVYRFRRELLLDDGLNEEESIARTMHTAGRTVLLSGASVAIGLATLLFIPVPFVRSLGVAGIVVPLVSIVAALTLQPALLSIFGRRGVTPHGFSGLMARVDLSTGTFAKLAHKVMQRPFRVIAISFFILAFAISPILGLRITPSSLTTFPSEIESATALTMITDRVGHGVVTPNQIVIDLGARNLTKAADIESARVNLVNRLARDPEVFVVATDSKPPFVDSSGRYMRILVINRHDLGAAASQNLVHKLRQIYIPQSHFPSITKIYLGGAPAQGVDLVKKILGTFPWIIFFALGLAYLVLVRAFRSLVLPLLAICLDLLSLAVAYAVQVAVFKNGFGTSILGFQRIGQIEIWVIVFLFAVLFGLSMDYEVFIVSRMREAKSRGATNAYAIVEGLSHTGGVVTAAAAILISALTGFIVGHFAGLQQLGVGLASGVLVDATVIRLLILPSAMALLGRWNWWLPAFAARLLHTKASPLEAREVRL